MIRRFIAKLRGKMDEDELPKYSRVDQYPLHRRRRRHGPPKIVKFAILACLGYIVYSHRSQPATDTQLKSQGTQLSTSKLRQDYVVCSKLRSIPQDPSGAREKNARYIEGHKPVLIRNATVWTGEPVAGTSPDDAHSGKGWQWISSDVYMEHGLIKRVESGITEADVPDDCIVYDARGRPLTSGIVDMHSHSTVDSLPELRGNEDTNELSSDIAPYVRSLDGINPLDHQLQVIKSGGVTTSLILPGSGNNMGGEAYVIKHAVGKADGRLEISANDMLADPERTWRYMKMACGENPKTLYGRVGRDFGPFSRLGEAWEFRHAFEQASAMVRQQDDWCAAADTIGAENMATYLPQDLQWESLGALLRGQVLLNTHCYTIPDLEAFIRHTNEFKFRIRAFHHAHQTYLVPEILKRAWGGRPPAAALFADNMYYKAEAYVASEQAGKILNDNGITPVYVSDNPVINAQHVVFEAAKAYHNGLDYHAALAGVTSASAELLGLGERIGKVKPGFDADIVVWDSDPLSVGAAPVQVWIDGTPQFKDPVELEKPVRKPLGPMRELEPVKLKTQDTEDVVFEGVTKFMLPNEKNLSLDSGSTVVVQKGAIVCVGQCQNEVVNAMSNGAKVVTLSNGYFAPALTAFASSIGLAEITAEASTQDGDNNDATFSRAIDGLALDNKNLKEAFKKGVTDAISAPTFLYGGSKGVSAGFRTGAAHALEKNAVWEDEVALHYALTKSGLSPSISSAIGLLRTKLLKAITLNGTEATGEAKYLRKVVDGDMPLVINVHSADTIASLLRLKAGVEAEIAQDDASAAASIRLIIVGGAESHLLAEELAAANVGVVLAPLLPYSETWGQRRSLTGAPMTNGTTIDVLHAAGVTVAIGTKEDWETRDLYLSAGIAYANGGGKIGEKDALAFVSSNIYDMLNVKSKGENGKSKFVAFDGSPLELNSRIRAVADGRGSISMWV